MFFEYPLRAFTHTYQALKKMDHLLLFVGGTSDTINSLLFRHIA